eukprot:7737_1
MAAKIRTVSHAERWNNIDESTKDLVNGYVRNMHSTISKTQIFHNVPKEINYICALFFFLLPMDEFEKYLSKHQCIISENNSKVSYFYQHYKKYQLIEGKVFGKKAISSTFHGIYIWRIINLGPSKGVKIGIEQYNGDINAKNEEHNQVFDEYFYYYRGFSGTFWKNSTQIGTGSQFKKYDIITMKLDFCGNKNDGILSYKINDGKEMIASSISRDDHYNLRLCVILNEQNNCLQLLDPNDRVILKDIDLNDVDELNELFSKFGLGH